MGIADRFAKVIKAFQNRPCRVTFEPAKQPGKDIAMHVFNRVNRSKIPLQPGMPLVSLSLFSSVQLA